MLVMLGRGRGRSGVSSIYLHHKEPLVKGLPEWEIDAIGALSYRFL